MHKSFWDLVKAMPSLPASSTCPLYQKTSFSFAINLEYNKQIERPGNYILQWDALMAKQPLSFVSLSLWIYFS